MAREKTETEEMAQEVEEVLEQLKLAQEADSDIRDMAREGEHFVYKRDGQWEPEVVTRFSDMPRYTFDQATPIIDSICGEIEQMDFACRAIPAGGDADEKTAESP